MKQVILICLVSCLVLESQAEETNSSPSADYIGDRNDLVEERAYYGNPYYSVRPPQAAAGPGGPIPAAPRGGYSPAAPPPVAAVPVYGYKYQVTAPPLYKGHTPTNFGHKEERNGYQTQGLYYVLLPDGRLQKVAYTVDKDSGYVAHVSYEGTAQYPPPAPPAPYAQQAAHSAQYTQQAAHSAQYAQQAAHSAQYAQQAASSAQYAQQAASSAQYAQQAARYSQAAAQYGPGGPRFSGSSNQAVPASSFIHETVAPVNLDPVYYEDVAKNNNQFL